MAGMARPVGQRRTRRRAAAAAVVTATAIGALSPMAGAQQDPILCSSDVLADAVDFTDVPASSPHHHAVACLSAYNVANGTGPATFSPSALMRRDQAAGLMARVAELAGELAAGEDSFTDDERSIFEAAINSLAELGVLQGRGENRFEPAGSLTRGQAASISIRILRQFGTVADGPDAFRDDEGSVHEQNINAAAALGIIEGFGDGTFRPNQPLTRGQGSSVMVKTLEEIADLLSAEFGGGQ